MILSRLQKLQVAGDFCILSLGADGHLDKMIDREEEEED